jgi:hypothetical protein
MFLKLKIKLTPYMYSLSRFAYDTGVPPVRAMALEFPDDITTFSNHTGSAQQFMAGPFFLVAPVYKPLSESGVRNGIYLPAGQWIDYWNGSIVSGPITINHYPVPLDILPVFVRGGAIIPMWPDMQYPGERSANPLTLDVYPSGNSTFQLYEDDGLTRQALEKSAYAVTNISCRLTPAGTVKSNDVELDVSASIGDYVGKLASRVYQVQLHIPVKPIAVHLLQSGEATDLKEEPSLSAWDFAESGWIFSNALKQGIVYIKTPSLATSSPFKLVIANEQKLEVRFEESLTEIIL